MGSLQGERMSGLVWNVLQAANRLTEVGNRLAAPFGLTAARWQVMGVIMMQEASIADIARALSQSRQGVQRLADDLVRDGMAVYRPNPRHARAKLLVPTPGGTASYQGLMQEQGKWMEDLARDLPVEDIGVARAVLAQLVSTLDAGRSSSTADED
ncbi:MarR family winged helix-turn-helix transcriptional regulator [Oryzibacter oryziterrae]|uniref:MarR family winged helix-turn-helix transcriptional regulator n=1 Tax=Oryzibacter oryziterrae TaxID=2766474 RepID=UPI001F02F559|nr:MarR family transcriptional regulator [Oryzibacter oryziterrae]